MIEDGPIASYANENTENARRWSGLWGILVSAIVVVNLSGPSLAAELADIRGVWLVDDGESAVEITACGAARCGRVIWLKDGNDEDGRPLLDRHNPDANLRSHPVCGLQIIGGLKPQLDGSWDQGRIYDPEEGKTYDLEIRSAGPDVLKVTGYLTIKSFGETLTWRRPAQALNRCSGR
ncbi:DUF2147 domain-containing protein [Microvirga alba]|uniref:DUF2147 domain-containing protein n=1 Tax=Microvirga alba TaxID=2791025 RepID=A0A931BQW4_9HYPH|nr:DUF2147 domain-containing protein [Microvirga alba]MBF9235271.1 DUF2147 domain-containing protein [Microvirga alba]